MGAKAGTSYVKHHGVSGRQGGTLVEFVWVLAAMLGLLVARSVLGEASSDTMLADPDPALLVLVAANVTGAGVTGPVQQAAAPSATSAGKGRQASRGIAIDRAMEVGTSGAETKASTAMEPRIPDAVVASIFAIFGLLVVSRRSVR